MPVRPRLLAAIVVCAVLGIARAPAAQELGPEDAARYHFGPVKFTPTVEIRNLGVDSNIFNDNSDPKQDFVASFGPAVDYWLRPGPTRLSGHSALQYDYFHQYATQRSFGTSNRARFEVLLLRLTPYVQASYDNTRRRPDYEIDARARYRTDALLAGADVHVLSKTVLRFEGERGHLNYDDGQEFEGSDLATTLNREVTAYRVSIRQALTPLTTFVVTGEQQTARFTFDHTRDADGSRVVPGFEFKPGAIISGKAAVGYASFRTLDPDVPDFSGVVANAELAYVARATRFGVHLVRDAVYSYEIEEPFYVVTDLGVTVTQKITMNWDLVARATHQWLDYQERVSSGLSPRNDTFWRAGGGTGRWLGQSLRVGFEVEFLKRQSPLVSRTYDGWRAGANILYGLPGQ